MSLYSHPNKLLIDHLSAVADGCRKIISTPDLFPGNKDLQKILADIAFIAGAFHDIGKATHFFQHYLLTDNHEIIGPKNHALISALFVMEVVKEYLSGTNLPEFDKELLVIMSFTAVRRHHGKLENIEDEVYIDLRHDNTKELQQQVLVFAEEDTVKIISRFNEPLCLQYNFYTFKKYILSGIYLEEMPAFYDKCFPDGFYEGIENDKKLSYFYFHQLLYSSLLLADKTDVILEANVGGGTVLADGLVEQYKMKKGHNQPKSELDIRKNEAFNGALNNLDAVFSFTQHIYSLTLPTGLGKTITSFAVAQKMKQLLGASCSRLIIAIPFTSIIDQNFEVYSEMVATKNSDVLLKHHHLSEPSYKTDETVLNIDESQFLIETWQSEIVVTTFVQLLNSLFSNDKALVMKLPNIANSIIILDEVQTIPYKYWKLVKGAFETLGRDYNCYFIMMSATQPLMFLPEKEIREIVPNYQIFFGFFNRTKLFNKTQTVFSLAAFTDEVCVYLESNRRKDVLIILNTKKHSKQCFEGLRDLIDNENEDIYYLSTLITPYERKKIIGLIKQNSSKRKIIVSTQLIEAGVDISVDTVFRTVAPIDSIIQASGRANRYGEKQEQGTIFLYDIEEQKRSVATIYGGDLIQKTKNVLSQVDEIEEKDYLLLIENYFKEVRKQSDNYFCKFLDGIYKLNYKDVGAFSLIEEKDASSIFIQLNTEAKEIWDIYVSIYGDDKTDIFQKRKEFAKIKSVFYDFVISVPIPRQQKSIAFDGEPQYNFYLSPLENPSRFYDYDENDLSQNTGYKEVNTLSY